MIAGTNCHAAFEAISSTTKYTVPSFSTIEASDHASSSTMIVGTMFPTPSSHALMPSPAGSILVTAAAAMAAMPLRNAERSSSVIVSPRFARSEATRYSTSRAMLPKATQIAAGSFFEPVFEPPGSELFGHAPLCAALARRSALSIGPNSLPVKLVMSMNTRAKMQ